MPEVGVSCASGQLTSSSLPASESHFPWCCLPMSFPVLGSLVSITQSTELGTVGCVWICLFPFGAAQVVPVPAGSWQLVGSG